MWPVCKSPPSPIKFGIVDVDICNSIHPSYSQTLGILNLQFPLSFALFLHAITLFIVIHSTLLSIGFIHTCIYIYIYPCWSNNLTLQYGQIVNVEVGSPPISIQKAPGRQHDWGGSLFTWFSLVAVWRIPSQKKIVGKFPLPSGKKWTVPSTILSHTSNGFMLDKGACTFWDWIEAFMETCKTDVQVSIGALLLPPRSSWTYFGSICGRSCVYIYGSWILIT